MGGDRSPRHRSWRDRTGVPGDRHSTQHSTRRLAGTGRYAIAGSASGACGTATPSGRGRKRLSEQDPDLRTALEQLVEPLSRGDPTSPLRWTCKSAAKLAAQLQAAGHPVSERTVNRMLHELGYRLQTNRKTLEGRQHPDRDAQFAHINERCQAFQAQGQPVISVDTKKKELIGQYRNGGREWRPQGRPEEVKVYDFPDKGVGQGDSIRGIRLGGQRGLGQCRGGPRHGAFAVETIRRLVAADGRACLWRGTTLADHGRRWRLQRQPQPPVEVGAAAARR